MRIKRSAVIIYGSTNKKKGMRNSKVIDYKNKRYLEIMQDIVNEYDEIILLDKNSSLYSAGYEVKEEEEIIRCIYSGLKKVKNSKALVISSDIPLVNKKLVNYMGQIEFDEDVLIPYADEKLQNLCAVYNKKMLKVLEHIIENEEISFDNLFNNISMRYIFPKDKSMFISVDKLEKYIIYCK